VLFTITPVLTTLFAIVLGYRSYEKNSIQLEEDSRRTAEESNIATERHNERNNDLRARFATFETESGTVNLMEAAKTNGAEVTRHIDALNHAALGEVKDRYSLHIKKLPNILSETLNEALLNLETSGSGIGVLTSYEPSDDFKQKAKELKEPEKSFVAMAERQLKESDSRRGRVNPTNTEEG
jgi:hypothetical protein